MKVKRIDSQMYQVKHQGKTLMAIQSNNASQWVAVTMSGCIMFKKQKLGDILSQMIDKLEA